MPTLKAAPTPRRFSPLAVAAVGGLVATLTFVAARSPVTASSLAAAVPAVATPPGTNPQRPGIGSQAGPYPGFHTVTGIEADGNPELFGITSTGGLVHDRWTGSAWSGWTALPGTSLLGSPSVVRNTSGSLEVFARTATGQIVHDWETGSNSTLWAGTAPIGPAGSVIGDPAALVWSDGHAEVFATGPGNTLVHAWREADGRDWTAFYPLGGPSASPPVVATGAGHLPELFATSPTGLLLTDRWTGRAWSGLSPLPGLPGTPLTGTPSVMTNRSGTLEVFVRTAAGQLVHDWQTAPGSTTWAGPAGIGPPGGVAADPAALVWPDGHPEVFEVTAAGTIVHSWRLPSGQWTGWVSLGGSATGTVDVWQWSTGRPELAVRFAGGTFSHAWWTGTGWSGWAGLGGDFILSGLSAAQLAGQRVVYSYTGLTPPTSLVQAVRTGLAAGVVFFANNITSSAQLAGVAQQLQEANDQGPLRVPLLLMTDEEGGLVDRLPGPFPSEKQIGAAPNSAALATQVGAQIGLALRSAGLNMDLAPVLDVYRQAGNFIDQYQRSYSSNPSVVSTDGAQMSMEMQGTGVAATAKHFPGLGAAATAQNTDLVPVTLNVPLTQLRATDESVYQTSIGAGLDVVMVSWAVYPALDPSRPAGLSPTVVQGELRGRLGFRGVTVSDSLGAGALTAYGSPPQRGVLAAAAGLDLLLFSSTTDAVGGQAALQSALQSGVLPGSAFAAEAERVVTLRTSVSG